MFRDDFQFQNVNFRRLRRLFQLPPAAFGPSHFDLGWGADHAFNRRLAGARYQLDLDEFEVSTRSTSRTVELKIYYAEGLAPRI